RSVTPAKLSFTPPSIARPITPRIVTDEIADAAVTSAKLSFSVPTRPMTPPLATDEIADASVTTVKIAANSITAGKIASGAVGASEIQSGAVSTDEIANGAVTAEKLAPGVGGSRITFLPTRIQLTGLIINGNLPWQTSAPNPSIPPEATALIMQIELVQQSIPPPPPGGWINCRIRRDATQQECYAIGVEAKNVGQVFGGQVIVPIVSQSFEYSFTDAYGNISVTFNPYVVGYIV
ncbi:MAG: hypothetical protein AAB019_08140, partial [Planctomycetota bacterium]